MTTTKKTLVLSIPRNEVLNANNMTGMNRFVKSKISKSLKQRGFDAGFEELPADLQKIMTHRKNIIDSEENNKIIKSRLTKKFKKSHPDLSAKDIKQLVEDEFDKQNLTLDSKSGDILFEPVFNKFKIVVLVSGPTTHRIDPANFSPTTKHIIDGLTWCGFWVDDDWKHLEEISFKFGGVNDTKTNFIFTFEIEELEGTDN